MRSLLFLRLTGNRGESLTPGLKRGLAPDRIFHLGARARLIALKLLAVLCPRVCEGSWVSEQTEAKENRKIPWDALLSRGMLAHGSASSNETRGKKGKFWARRRNLFALELWKDVRGEDKIARTSTGYSH